VAAADTAQLVSSAVTPKAVLLQLHTQACGSGACWPYICHGHVKSAGCFYNQCYVNFPSPACFAATSSRIQITKRGLGLIED